MNRDEVLAAYERQVRIRQGERVGRVVRKAAKGGWNGILWSDLDEDTADAEIAAQRAYFAALKRDFEWKLYSHDRPADLADRLLAAGFTAEPEETLMAAEAAAVAAEPRLPEGVELRVAEDPAGIDLLVRAHEQAFGMSLPGLRERVLRRLTERPESIVAVVAMAGDRPISGARLTLDPDTEFAGLFGGGTVAGWRGRGVYRALVAHRARVAVERGYRYLHVDASADSRPILLRLGFEPLGTTTPYVRAPGA
ncbi:GNAT family N-acetyltransferase [Nonomuraea roseoviolacea subsp. roseoviolacea]|uniref:GNAT superfamily N-acetyltransferase n=1 Tax=Nonomuraea roseoviolacea subsp. carminata TaxID=160689 RepID=A0ABT1K135_9ACTN|nr:GNAT family N-acetyltransferase [Nonomuraea roseoviolacea]MCP2347211.1 GNAT superfamily N-acetyltransferase [Nonomuraea roseoviolacea subsp. carminata]